MPHRLRRYLHATPVLVLLLLFVLMSLPSVPGRFLGLSKANASPSVTFNVNTTGDAADSSVGDGVCNDGSGACTLRAAIQEANALAGEDTINFAASLNGSAITLNVALPDISTNLTINGPGSTQLTVRRTTAAGAPDFRIFTINSPSVVTISGLSISNGKVGTPPDSVPGGGILNAGTLTLNNCNVSSNSSTGPGGGIQNAGSLTVNDSSVTGNTGGGIANNIFGGSPTATINNSVITGNTGNSGVYNNAINATNTLVIRNSTISGNSTSGFGGGVYNFSGSFTSRANATIDNCTISGNTSGTGGGGIGTGAFFGFAVTTLTITNSTVSGNSDTATSSNNGGGGGIFHISNGQGAAATLTINNVTITNNVVDSNANGGGILINDSFDTTNVLNLRNTIVAANRRNSGTSNDIFGTIDPASSFNLIGDGTGVNGVSNGSNGNQIGTSLAPIMPRLGALVNNGGPTLTHALLPGSPALDAGSNGNLPPDTSDLDGDSNTTEPIPFDQRGAGLIRVVDSADADSTATVDIGAFEAQVALDDISDKTINEDTSLQFPFNVGGLITSVTATSSNATLVPNDAAHIAVTGSGSTRTLSINPPADQFGTATITVSVNGSNGQTMSDTFTLGVTAINDAPSFTKGADQTVGNNAGLQTISNWATNISAGANESGQTVAFIVSGNTNPGLFSVQPSVSPTGTLTFQPNETTAGTANITIFLQDNGGVANGGQNTSPSQTFTITVNAAGGLIKLDSASMTTTESSGFTTAKVVRTGDPTLAVRVNYATSGDTGMPCSTASGLASPKCDFTAAAGTLNFAAGETTKTVTLLVNQDSFVEGPEDFTLTLSNPTSFAVLATPSTATITITDDATEPTTNPIDTADAFVRQHYHDFLNREGDASGLAFWTNQITECEQPGATCSAEIRRINVSAAFFLSIEFQETGYLVYRMYKTSYGDITGTPVPVSLSEWLPDTQQVGKDVIIGQPGANQQLENNKVAFAQDFVSRARFTTAYPTTITPAQFVDALFTNAGVTPSAADRDAAINEFGGAANTADTAARARALRRVADNSTFKQQEINRAFVLMEYFGYLRRNPNNAPEPGLNFDGYNFWLNKLNQFGGNFVNAEMVKAFIISGEYRHRFGP